MSKKYPTATDGEWMTPRRRGFMLGCCDCGLMHRLDFKLITMPNHGKKIQFRAFRHVMATAQIRRYGEFVAKLARKAKRRA